MSPVFDERLPGSRCVYVLRGGSSDSWVHDYAGEQAQFIRDEYSRRLLAQMGHASAEGRFAHLFLNGAYWGIYNVVPRLDEDFMAACFGGKPDDWTILKDDLDAPAAREVWEPILRLAGQVKQATAEAIQQQLYSDICHAVDIDNYIDYLLVNFYCGNTDWPDKNFVAARRSEQGPLKLFCWDSEWTLGLRSPVHDDAVSRAKSGIAELFHLLKDYHEFAHRFSQRVNRHFLQRDGLFFLDHESSVNMAAALYVELSEEVEDAIGAEAARWGDQDGTAFGRDDWQRERHRLVQSYFPRRADVVLKYLSEASLYDESLHSLTQPAFSRAQESPVGR